jgi:hypothetical protein
MWRSLAARLLWEQEVPGSNPGIPTSCGGSPGERGSCGESRKPKMFGTGISLKRCNVRCAESYVGAETYVGRADHIMASAGDAVKVLRTVETALDELSLSQ